MKIKELIWSGMIALAGTSAFAQNPAVVTQSIQSGPLLAVGDEFTIVFHVGNTGSQALTGIGENNRMGFKVTLNKSIPVATGALSGTALTSFDIVYDAGTRTYSGFQKSGVSLPAGSVRALNIKAKVAVLSANIVTADIGASINIQPSSESKRSGGNITSDDHGSIFTYTTDVLPVTLIAFDIARESQTILLNWTTTSETNSDHFEIERSKNGKSWKKIGTLLSHGESTSLKNYTFTDTEPADGENLYRLRMVDKDGTFAYSRIRSVHFEQETIAVYPNPVSDHFTILTDWSKVKSVDVVDGSGRKVYAVQAENSIDVRNFASGLYVVSITYQNGEVKNRKVVISR